MKSPDRYLIGPGLRTKLREVITRVDGMADGGGADTIPVRLQDMPRGGGGNPILIGKTPCDWAVGECVTITLWEGTAGTGTGATCKPTQTSPVATIENVRNLSHDVPQGAWVAIGKAADGQWYLVEAGSEPGGYGCRKTIGGEDITTWPGWNASAVQLLGHDANGCLRWYDTNSCDTPPTPGY